MKDKEPKDKVAKDARTIDVKTLEAVPPPPGPDGPKLASGLPADVARKLAHGFTYPVERPFLALAIYYAVIIAIGAAAVRWIPGAAEMISGARLQELAQRGQSIEGVISDPAPWFVWRVSVSMALGMAGAFLLMVPTTWVYMAARARKGFDQSVVQTILILATAVAGVVSVARNSLALAFSLAGVVGAVRFRNQLRDPRDALYMLVAIGIGLASGVDALAAAAVFSLVFNLIALLLWQHEYATSELGMSPSHLLVGAWVTTNGEKRRPKGYNHVLLVRARNVEKAREPVEAILGTEARRFKLAEIETDPKGRGVLKYLIRLRKDLEPTSLEDALLMKMAPNVIGARIH
ncbi:MAG: DUF4956 domain-containing protein [Gemmatimonadales bacterium]